MPLMRGHHSFDGRFVQIPNAWVRDQRLSYKARGLLAELLSHQEGFLVSRERLARNGQDGDRAIRSAIAELEHFGYLSRSQTRTDDNRFGAALWITQDPHPAVDFPSVRFAPAGNAPAQNEGAKKTIEKKTREENTSLARQVERDFDEFWSYYPRRVAKADAKRAFLKLHKDHGSEILLGVKRLAADPNLPEHRFIPHPGTWLNREGWNDEPYPKRERTKEELREIELEKARRDRESAKRHAEEISRQMREAEANAAPIPLCDEHGISIIKCLPCASKLNTAE